ncbi:MAG: penicillin acylase family protein [Rhodoglobus sp.]
MSDDIRIITDEWGVVHVRAADAAGAFFGQGYAVASIRLFQMEMWRRRGLGLIADALGPDYVHLDVAARTFLARTTLAEEFAVLPHGTEEAVRSFVSGVNKRVREVLTDPTLLPIEFRAAGFLPGEWTAEAILSIRIHGLHSNAEEELTRATTLRDLGDAIDRVRRLREPDVAVEMSEGIDPAVLHSGMLDLYRAAHLPVVFPGATAPPPGPTLDGSNNWAVSGERTATGRPILATDPHRIMTVPALRTVVHLTCPEFDAIGMTEPYMPGVAAGHNDRVGYTFTIAPLDNEDIYLYEIDPANPLRYRYAGGWEQMHVVTEQIPVAGGEAHTVDIAYTRHGPVIHREGSIAVALRADWLHAGATPYLGNLGLLRSRSVADLRGALDLCAAPGLNFVAADVDGDILWQVAGRSPVREGWNGLLPVPGDGRYEWRGSRSARDLPGVTNPAAGWIRSANTCNMHEDPEWSGEPYSYEFYSGYRARRLAEALEGKDDWSVADTAALQNDYLSLSARDVLDVLSDDLAAEYVDEDAEFARTHLLAWDQRMTSDSAAAALFDRWLYRHLTTALRTAVAARLAPEGRLEATLATLLDTSRATVGDPRIDITLLAECVDWAVDAQFPGRRALVESTLAATVRDLGRDVVWADVQQAQFHHPLRGTPGFPDSLADTGAHPKPGSSDTVGLAFGADGVQTLGAATRIVMDVGDWDSSVFVTMPGVASDVENPHSHDLFTTWLHDGTVPLLFSAAAVDAHAESDYVIPSMAAEERRN